MWKTIGTDLFCVADFVVAVEYLMSRHIVHLVVIFVGLLFSVFLADLSKRLWPTIETLMNKYF